MPLPLTLAPLRLHHNSPATRHPKRLPLLILRPSSPHVLPSSSASHWLSPALVPTGPRALDQCLCASLVSRGASRRLARHLSSLTSHNPLTRAITLGADLAKEHALRAIPQELAGVLALPVIQLINQYVGPYALIGEAFMGTWAILLTLILPASFLLLGFATVHGVLLLGGAPGGWKGTARTFLINHAYADLATLAWAGLILALKLSFLSQCGLLLVGLLLIRLIAHTRLLISLSRAHSLGALRIIFLGLPALLCSLALAILLSLATWTWLASDLALAALR